MNVKEAREALAAQCHAGAIAVRSIMEAADAYGDARELKGHVEACEAVPPAGIPVFHCGDGWYCDVAKELGK